MTRQHLRASTLAMTTALAMALGACGDDEDGGRSASTPATTPQTAAPPQTVDIQVDDKAFTGAPATLEAGAITFAVSNEGKREHEAQLIRVDAGQTAEEVSKVVEKEGGPIPSWMHGAGGPISIQPGATKRATAILEAGTYHLLDLADDKGVPSKTFEVTGDAGGAKLPATEAKVIAKDFELSATGLTTGTNAITLENTGKELHHALLFPISKGKTIADVKKAFASDEGESEGPPPVDFEAGDGTGVIDGGTTQVFEITLDKPGKYAAVCFIQNRAGGPPHAVLGMVQEVEVK